ncbi:unnamed protein product [Rotaria sp. Silwood1]|nr:unnamed protein product [Rotaria sp. Silwood1]CAF1634101.1 unnamed protein product [Rotaria sp. Silwood1]
MDKMSKSFEVLKLISTRASETLIIRSNNENHLKLVTAVMETLFTTCVKNDYDIRLATKENLNKLVKVLKKEILFFV